jgi:hypothetical protein
MQEERRAVLERVARGELSPAEAATLLEELESNESPQPEGDRADPRDWAADWAQQPEWTAPPPPEGGSGATRIRVVRSIGTADIIGDPTVREAVAEGPHLARREGDTLVIEGRDDDPSNVAGFVFSWPERHQRIRHRHRGPRFRWGDVTPLRVRVNPDLPLDVEAQAGRLRISGVHGPIRANVQAGGTDISDFRAPLDLTVQAGSITARGRMDQGASRIVCNAGSVRIHLERGSSVRVSAHSTLGKVIFHGHDDRSPWLVGGGDGSLDIDATMGTVGITAE